MNKFYTGFVSLIALVAFYFYPINTLARQVSNFPNGSIIKSISGPKVYYIDGGVKRPIESPNMLVSQFRWQDLIIASPVEVDAVSEGTPMTYAEGSLLSNEGKLYVISNGKRRAVISPQFLLSKNYKLSNVITVSKSELLIHPEDTPIQENEFYPDGTLLSSPKGEVYIIQAGTKRYIPSPTIFEAKYKWENVIQVTQEVIDKYPRGNDQYYPDGSLISSNTGVFLMQDNLRRPITSPEVFESYGFSWSQIRRATDYELSIIPEGQALSEIKSYRSRVLVSPTGSPAV